MRFVLINFTRSLIRRRGDRRQKTVHVVNEVRPSVLVAGRQAEFYGNNPSWKNSEKNGKGRDNRAARTNDTKGQRRKGKCNSGTFFSPSPHNSSFLEISLGSPIYIRIPSLFVKDIEKRKLIIIIIMTNENF